MTDLVKLALVLVYEESWTFLDKPHGHLSKQHNLRVRVNAIGKKYFTGVTIRGVCGLAKQK